MRKLRAVCNAITGFNVFFLKGYRFLVLVMMSIMVYEVVVRYIFNAPTAWSYELTGMLVGPLFLFAAVSCMATNEHIRLDLVYGRLSPRRQGIIDMITWMFFWSYIGVVLYYGWQSFWFSFTMMSRTCTLWAPVLWPWKLTVPLGCFLLLLQGIVTYANAVHKAITGRELE